MIFPVLSLALQGDHARQRRVKYLLVSCEQAFLAVNMRLPVHFERLKTDWFPFLQVVAKATNCLESKSCSLRVSMALNLLPYPIRDPFYCDLKTR